jgi:hypothetical protein
MEWARNSCRSSSRGGATSREEYSNCSSVEVSFGVDDLEVGNRVKSIDASIHQLGSSSCKIILDLSVSIESIGFPSEKFLYCRSVGLNTQWKLEHKCLPTWQNPPYPVPTLPDVVSRSPLHRARWTHQTHVLFSPCAREQPARNRKRSDPELLRPYFPRRDCRWLGMTAALVGPHDPADLR